MSRFALAILFGLSLASCSRNDSTAEPPPIAIEQGNEEGPPPPRPQALRSGDEALAAGVEYLLKQQSEDGAWRSDVYATFKDGTALTPLVVAALQEAGSSGL